jgi:hypothetical protein
MTVETARMGDFAADPVPEMETPSDAVLGGGSSEGDWWSVATNSRWHRARRTAMEHVAFLRRVGKGEIHVPEAHVPGTGEVFDPRPLVWAIEDCGSWLRLARHGDRVRVADAVFCRKPLLCPLCAIRRGARAIARYLPRFQAVMAEQPGLIPVLLTLTVRNGGELGERIDHLRGAFQALTARLRKGRRTSIAPLVGMVGSIEVTKGNGWHPHIHAIALLRDYIDQSALSREWNSITGDSFIVGITEIREENQTKSFAEVFKYAMKFSSLKSEDLWVAFHAVKGRRLLFSTGCFRGLDDPIRNEVETSETQLFRHTMFGYERVITDFED